MMNDPKRTITFTDDDFSDYFPDDYPASLLKGFTVPEDGIDLDGIVTRFLAWLGRESGRSADVRYEMSRYDAAVLLEHFAGAR
jgi:hypothetical protein